LKYAQPVFDITHIEAHASESLNETSTNSTGHIYDMSGNAVNAFTQSDAPQVLMIAQRTRPIQRITTQVESEYRGADPIVEPEKVTLDTVEKSATPKVLSVEVSEREMAEEPSNSVAIPVASATTGIESDIALPSKAESPLFRQSRSHATRSYRRSRPSSPALVEADIQHVDNGPSEAPSILIPAVAMDHPPKSAKIQRMSMPDLETLAGSAKQNHPGIESTAEHENNTTMESTLHSKQSSSTLTSTSTSTSTTPSAAALARRASRQPGRSTDSPATDVPQLVTAEECAPVADNDKVLPVTVPVTVPETSSGLPERPRRKKKGKREVRDD